jgi:hypothetical protein
MVAGVYHAGGINARKKSQGKEFITGGILYPRQATTAAPSALGLIAPVPIDITVCLKPPDAGVHRGFLQLILTARALGNQPNNLVAV